MNELKKNYSAKYAVAAFLSSKFMIYLQRK